MSESVDVNLNNVGVGHNEEARRFELYINGLRALLTYRLSLDRIVLLHTEVPQSLEGQGLAAKLTRFALDFARAATLVIRLKFRRVRVAMSFLDKGLSRF